jgi:hypothetical protein
MTKKIFFSTFLLSLVALSMQAQDVRQRLSHAMQQKRIDAYFDGVNPFANDAETSPDALLDLLPLYGNDSIASVRDFTTELYALVYAKTQDPHIRQTAVELLCAALSDSVSYIRSTAAVALEDVPKDAFTARAVQLVVESFSAYGDFDEEQALLAGYLGGEELDNVLRQQQYTHGLSSRARWCCYLALARMGDESALDFILSAVQQQGVNDRVVYNYFPDLAYTRQQKAIDYLVTELFSNAKNCHSPNPNASQEMVCGYRIMEMLAPIVKDFPLALTASGAVAAKNYEKALLSVRKWFKKHGTNYVILNDRF